MQPVWTSRRLNCSPLVEDRAALAKVQSSIFQLSPPPPLYLTQPLIYSPLGDISLNTSPRFGSQRAMVTKTTFSTLKTLKKKEVLIIQGNKYVMTKMPQHYHCFLEGIYNAKGAARNSELSANGIHKKNGRHWYCFSLVENWHCNRIFPR